YEKTLLAWEGNFERSWDALKDHYGERFYRMCRVYLLSCAGAFRARALPVYQFLFSKGGKRYLPSCVRWVCPEGKSSGASRRPARSCAYAKSAGDPPVCQKTTSWPGPNSPFPTI